jgi:peroxiredoxin
MNSASREEARLPLAPVPVEPGPASLQIGSPAPVFSYLAADGRWHSFADLLEHDDVVLVFAPTDEDLAGIERQRDLFEQIDIRPVAVTDLSTRRTTALAKRLPYSGLLVSDPMAAIASLFHSIDSGNGTRVRSYFVIDKKLRLRAMYFGPIPPSELLLATAARSLGRALPPSAFTTTTDR